MCLFKPFLFELYVPLPLTSAPLLGVFNREFLSEFYKDFLCSYRDIELERVLFFELSPIEEEGLKWTVSSAPDNYFECNTIEQKELVETND
jgi:hypothetical protein